MNIIPYDNFGLFQLRICDAATLIVVDMWYMGTNFTNVPEPSDYEFSPNDPAPLDALAPEIQKFEKKLVAAINSKRIEASYLVRDFDENIVVSETLIHIDALVEWLNERGYETGDAFNDWLEQEGKMHDRLEEEAVFLRKSTSSKESMLLFGTGAKLDIDMLEEPDSLRQAAKSLLLENIKLTAELEEFKKKAKHEEASLHPRRRKTLLKVIAVLFKHLNMDLGKPGVAKIVERWSESDPLNRVDEDTIKGILVEAQEAFGKT